MPKKEDLLELYKITNENNKRIKDFFSDKHDLRSRFAGLEYIDWKDKLERLLGAIILRDEGLT